MAKVKAVIFDLDGTLAETGDMCIHNVMQTFSHYGLEPELGGIFETFGASELGTFTRFVPEHAKEAFERYLDITRSNHHMCEKPFEGMTQLLEYLHARVKVGLITGKSFEAAQITLSVLGIIDYFDEMICGEPLNFKKPADMRKMCADFGISTGEAVYVGDMFSDVRSANEAGLISIAAQWSEQADVAALRAEHPDFEFSSVEEFDSYLRSVLE